LDERQRKKLKKSKSAAIVSDEDDDEEEGNVIFVDCTHQVVDAEFSLFPQMTRISLEKSLVILLTTTLLKKMKVVVVKVEMISLGEQSVKEMMMTTSWMTTSAKRTLSSLKKTWASKSR
jgi:hypothetical protein